jgi:hypothetical protein
MSKEWPPKGTTLTKEERQDVPALMLFGDGTWCRATVSAIYLRRPVPYADVENNRNVQAIFFDHGMWPARWGDYPPCASWKTAANGVRRRHKPGGADPHTHTSGRRRRLIPRPKMTPQKPIYVGKIRDHDVRFFQPQSDDDKMPWVADGDLQRAIGVPRPFRRVLAHDPTGRVSIRTASGLTPVISFARATGLIQAAMQQGWTTDVDICNTRGISEEPLPKYTRNSGAPTKTGSFALTAEMRPNCSEQTTRT